MAMSKEAIRETLGFLGVAASLIFVGWEIRQNTVVARAATRHAIVDNSFEFILSRASDPELNRQVREWRKATGECSLSTKANRVSSNRRLDGAMVPNDQRASPTNRLRTQPRPFDQENRYIHGAGAVRSSC